MSLGETVKTDTEKFLAILGRIARDFSMIEDTVTLFIERYIGNRMIAQIFIKRMNFSIKCDRLQELLDVVEISEKDKESILKWLNNARVCAKVRNYWLHTPTAVNEEGALVSIGRNDECMEYNFDEISLQKAKDDSDFIYSVMRLGLGSNNE